MINAKYCVLMTLPAILAMSQQEAKAKAKKNVNILVIISDDHSAEHLGCYGNKDIVTPNIDSLASQGMRFDRAYVTCPQSAPSRTSIFTGRNPVGIATSRFSAPLDISIPTFPEVLSQVADYYTGVVGRNHHLDGVEDGQGGPYAATYITENNFRTAERRFDFVRTLEDRNSPNGAQGQINQFVEFMESRPKNKPFFCQLGFNDPHRPYTAEKFHDPASLRLPLTYPDTKLVREDLAAYYDEIHRLDENVGKVLRYLDDHDLAENTIVFFLGDNGGAQFRGKGTLYELGIRVPMIVRWPDKVTAGSVCREIVSCEDIAPTFIDIAGVKIPENITGVSLKNTLLTSSVPKRKYLFAERGAHACMLPTENNAGFDLSRVIVSQRFKLIYNALITLKFSPVDFAGTPMYRQLTKMYNEGMLGEPFDSLYFNKDKRPLIELFDLEVDPYELHNLADDPVYFEIKKELLKEITGWMIRERDFLPTPDAVLRLNNPNK